MQLEGGGEASGPRVMLTNSCSLMHCLLSNGEAVEAHNGGKTIRCTIYTADSGRMRRVKKYHKRQREQLGEALQQEKGSRLQSSLQRGRLVWGYSSWNLGSKQLGEALP